jgi:hypothetical protein
MADDGRLLTCTRCRERVRVYEPQGEWIDPDLYVCGTCRPPDGGRGADAFEQLRLGPAAEGLREETRDYDPLIARIPF